MTVHGGSLEGNLLGDSPDRTITVYLPPSYDRAPERRYPVIYLLGGFHAVPELAKMPGFGVKDIIFAPADEAIAGGKLGEVILVNIEGWNRLGGSFWVNSSTTGNWEDFVTHDVIATIDAKFRTITERYSRGLYGGSMGGFGAISIAMHRPDLFGTVFAQSPCCLAMVEELGPAPTWGALAQVTLEQADAAFQHGDPTPLEAQALAAAFAPDSGRAPFYGDLPYRVEGDRVLPNDPAYSRWIAQLPAARLDREAAGLKSLHGFRIQYGDHDTLRHIVASVPALDSALTAHGVPHELHVDHGGHVEIERFANDAIPFFARTLAGAAGRSAPAR
jgi:enterochelin esterase-like enzyme